MIKVVKCGGQVLDQENLLEAFCRDFAALEGPKVLVHGGGALAGRFQKALGMEPVKLEGRRVTDGATLQVVTMVYAGWCNKQVVALLQADGCRLLLIDHPHHGVAPVGPAVLAVGVFRRVVADVE